MVMRIRTGLRRSARFGKTRWKSQGRVNVFLNPLCTKRNSHKRETRGKKMKIKSEDFQVQEGEKVNLKKWPTLVEPVYKSKKKYQKLPCRTRG